MTWTSRGREEYFTRKLASQTKLKSAPIVNDLHSSKKIIVNSHRISRRRKISPSVVPVTQILTLHMRPQWKIENTLFHHRNNNNDDDEVSCSVFFVCKKYFLLLVERWIPSSADGKKIRSEVERIKLEHFLRIKEVEKKFLCS